MRSRLLVYSSATCSLYKLNVLNFNISYNNNCVVHSYNQIAAKTNTIFTTTNRM